jgi:hypothetical protein
MASTVTAVTERKYPTNICVPTLNRGADTRRGPSPVPYVSDVRGAREM